MKKTRCEVCSEEKATTCYRFKKEPTILICEKRKTQLQEETKGKREFIYIQVGKILEKRRIR